MRHFPPRRIVCLTEETVETLYLLGEQDRIVGVSGYAVRPPQVRKEKPRVSAFISADIPKILALEPDLVLAFSDLQGQLAADLAKAGIAVHVFNQRDIAGIFAMIRMVGALVDASAKAEALADRLQRRLDEVAAAALAPEREAESLFRGMERSADQRHRLGLGADRGRRRHRRLSGASPRAKREAADHRSVTGRRCRARRHPRLLVRQEGADEGFLRAPRLDTTFPP